MQIDLDHYYKLISKNSELKKHLVTKCQGPWVYHGDTKKLDLQSGNSAFIYGFTDSDLMSARNSCNSYFVNNSDTETHDQINKLINRLETHTGMTAFTWAVSGSDAVEASIAVNDHYWQTRGEDKPTILVLDQCYHGTTYLVKSFRGNAPWVRHVTAHAPAWINIEDREEQEKICIEDIKQQLNTNDKIGAVLLESIPWIAGILPFSNSFWHQIRDLCTQYDVNLIIDDVAGCFGKLGNMVSHSTFQIEPDIVAIGKSLTGGYVPFGGSLICDRINRAVKDSKWDHTHTWCPVMDGIFLANVMIDKLEKDLPKVPHIAKRFTDTMKKYGIHSKGQGLFQEIWLPASEQDLYDCDLLVTLRSKNSIKVMVPIIADDEYFDFLDKAMKKLISLIQKGV